MTVAAVVVVATSMRSFEDSRGNGQHEEFRKGWLYSRSAEERYYRKERREGVVLLKFKNTSTFVFRVLLCTYVLLCAF